MLQSGLIYQVLAQTIQAHKYLTSCHLSIFADGTKDETTIWKLPPNGPVKINIDGSSQPDSYTGAYGGIIHDLKGKILSYFSKRLGYCSVILAKLWSLKYGIQSALSKMDVLEVVQMVEGIKNAPQSLRPLILDIRRMLLAHGRLYSLVHIKREANFAADQLLNLAV